MPSTIERGRDKASLLYLLAFATNGLLAVVYVGLLASPQASWFSALYAVASASLVYLAQKRRGVFVGLLGLIAGLDVLGLVVFAFGGRNIPHGGVLGTALFGANVIAGLALIAFQIQLQFKGVDR
ncbi:MAG: hypothetical protein ACYC96_16425 [Fimbriimonadaceae bacterium]